MTTTNKIIYKNKYGKLEIEPIADYQHVSEIHSKNVNQDCFFDINTAEKIALITDNHNIQISFAHGNFKEFYLVHHIKSDIARVCKINYVVFDNNINATKEIELLKENIVF
jgi:hypothetical protein